MSLKTVTVADIAAPDKRSIAIGPFGSSLKADLYVPSGVPVVRGQNIKDGGELDESDLVFVEPETAARFPACLLNEGDLVFPHRGAIGRVGIVGKRQMLLSSSMMKLTVDPLKADPRFVLYYFRGPGQNELLMRASTVGTPGIGQPLTSLRGIPIQIPELDQQRAIAEVLGALDDKIAANTRLTQTLDNYFMARWSALSENDSLKQVKLTELVGNVIGGDWGNSESTDTSTEEVLCIRGADIADLQGSGLGSMPRRFIKPTSLRRRRLAHMDLVVEMSGGSPTQSTGRVVLITDAMLKRLPLPLSSSNFCRIVRLGNSQDAYFIYALLRESWTRGEFFQFENGSTGIKNLAFADFCSSKEVRMPEQSHLQNFNRLADGLFMQMQSLGEESAHLRASRDALLPQLMSGKLRVKDAEKVLENAGV